MTVPGAAKPGDVIEETVTVTYPDGVQGHREGHGDGSVS